MSDPRTVNHIMADLLTAAVRGEWAGEVNMDCHCHPQYVRCCRECGALEEKHRNNNDTMRRAGEHEDGCSLGALFEEARAFLRVENDLAEKRDDWDATVHIS